MPIYQILTPFKKTSHTNHRALFHQIKQGEKKLKVKSPGVKNSKTKAQQGMAGGLAG